MCGISGKYCFNNEDVPIDIMNRMNESLFHRGPDSNGMFIERNIALGVQRLSILDVEHGQQPVSNEDKSIWTVFNGEIYNYGELRDFLVKKGHTLKTNCDTEVLPHLYEEFGVGLLEKIRGMFAFALWDKKNETLFLARDRIGIKPLYFFRNEKSLIFASEIKAILKDGEVKREVDPCGLNCYFSYNYLPSKYTIFRNIRKLLPGHYLLARGSNIEIRQYWEVCYDTNNISLAAAEEKCEYLLRDITKSHLNADVPLGIFLSGGLDSATLAYFINMHRKGVNTFNLRFIEKSFDEGEDAYNIVKQLNTLHHETIMTAEQCRVKLCEIAGFLDNPLGEPSALPTFFLANFAKNHIKVAISGEGMDEMLCGYLTYQADILSGYYQVLPSFIKSLANSLVSKLPGNDKYLSLSYKAKLFAGSARKMHPEVHYYWREVFSQEEKSKLFASDYLQELRRNNLFGEPFEVYSRTLKKISTGSNLNKYLFFDFKIFLPDNILYRVDSMSMANSLEVRVPYLDHRFVEFISGLPLEYKIRYLCAKYLLRRIMKNKLSASLIGKRKHGFGVPISIWLKRELKDLCLEYLSERKVKEIGMLNYDYIVRLSEEHFRNQHDNGRKLWNLIMFLMWYEKFI